MIRFRSTSPGGRVFAVVLMLMCLLIGVAALWFNAETLWSGETTIRLRGGGRIHADGWVARAYAVNGLIFGIAALCFACVFGAAGLGPQRWGRALWPLLRAGAVLFMIAACGAVVVTLLLFARSV